MNILITGGNGVIGRQLARELVGRGHTVVRCDLMHDEDETPFSMPYFRASGSYFRCDIREYRQLEKMFAACDPFDVVYHAAAEFGRWNGEDYYENLWATNVVGTKHLLQMRHFKLNPFRLVHFSSSEVYGDWPSIMVETVMDKNEVKQLNDYAMTKWVNEMQIRNDGGGMDSVVVRLFNTYGPGEYYSPYRSVNCRFLYCALKGIPWTVFRGHSRTSTFLADTIRTLAEIADAGSFNPGETYNIGGSQNHTIEELSDLVLKVTGASRSLVSYQDSEFMTTKVKNVDISKSVRDLGHQNTVGLEEGLAITADWMRKVYNL